jgi:RNA polymerase sigma-70 factor (ECF subfamily)
MVSESDVLMELREALVRADRFAVETVLDDDAVLIVDSGNILLGSDDAVRGRRAVADVLVQMLADERATLSAHRVNGEDGMVLRRDGRAIAVLAVNIQRDAVATLWLVVNPDKLARWPVEN